jgi:hypothetical protein
MGYLLDPVFLVSGPWVSGTVTAAPPRRSPTQSPLMRVRRCRVRLLPVAIR